MARLTDHEIERLIQENQELKALVAILTARIAELEARLNMNSKNSGKPPSSDGPRKGEIKNSRVRGGKPNGGQPGHKGTTLGQNPNPDSIVELFPSTVCGCGGHITAQTGGYTTRQTTDIEPVKVVTTEYRAHGGICEKCGKTHKASFPEGVNGTASYGVNLQATLTYLNAYQLLPMERITELMDDLLGVKVSQGTIVNSSNKAYEALAETEERIKEEIIQCDVAHFDETGMRVRGKTHWLHSAGTMTNTVYGIHTKRGKEAMDAMGILPRFRGTAIHDHWKSYYHYILCAHGECNQHILRELKLIFEDLKQEWAGEMICLLLRIKEHVDLTKLFNGTEASLSQEDTEVYAGMYRRILADAEDGKAQAPAKARRMLTRLAKYEGETLLFMYDFDVPFTNNLAEQDVRMTKTKQKVSGGFRSVEGADAFARIRGFVSTASKRGKGVYDGLVAVFNGRSADFLFGTVEPDSS